MKKIEIDGKKYTVIESLGYVHTAGLRAKAVRDGMRERIAVLEENKWRFWSVEDRLKL